jgi:hypothetical protein
VGWPVSPGGALSVGEPSGAPPSEPEGVLPEPVVLALLHAAARGRRRNRASARGRVVGRRAVIRCAGSARTMPITFRAAAAQVT